MLTIEQHELKSMLIEAARIGANQAIDDLVTCNLKDAAHKLGISSPTLYRRMTEGKIRAVDGRISGAEIRRYLTEFGRNV